jgi:hypothetical protein
MGERPDSFLGATGAAAHGALSRWWPASHPPDAAVVELDE